MSKVIWNTLLFFAFGFPALSQETGQETGSTDSLVPIVQAGQTTMSVPYLHLMQLTQARGMAEEDLDNVDDEVMNEVSEEQAINEDLVDPALATEITREKMGLIGPEANVPRHAGCGIVPRDRDRKVTTDAASPNAARQRSGSSTRCATLGVLQPTDNAGYYCFTVGSDSFTWTYLRNRRTGVRGWTRDDLLRDRGSFVYCGF